MITKVRVVPCGGGQDTAGTFVTRGNNAFATDEAGLVKSLAD